MRVANRFAKVEEADRRKREEDDGKKGGRSERSDPTNQETGSALTKKESIDQFLK